MHLFRGQPVAIALLSTLLVSSTAYAQDQKSDTTADSGKTDASKTDATKASETNNNTAKQTTAPTKGTTDQPSETGNNNTPTPTPTSDTGAVITGDSTGTNDVKVPQSTITDASASSDNAVGPTDLPQIPGGYKIPVAQVPPTLNAPYMQASKLPAGTVFIVVGAILGFLALAVVLWRGLTVWALKRSVKRAAKGNNVQDTKALLNFRPPAAPVYNRYSDRDSTLSLANLRKSPKPTRPTTSSGAAPGQSLFFSPTAGGSMLNPGNRNSGYLPSGYYAAGASAPGNGSGMAHLGGSGLTAREAISLSNLGPQAKGYARAQSLGTTPPDSPRVGPALSPGPQHGMHMSTSTLDLTQRPGGRAPSAYLEDLFDEAGAAPGNYPVNHPNYQGPAR